MGESGFYAGPRDLKLVGDVLFGADDLVQEWIAKRIPHYQTSKDSRALGVWKGNQLLAGVSFNGYNGRHVTADIAADPQTGWASRRTLRTLFSYPFGQLDCEAISVTVSMSNLDSLNLATKMGFKPEALVRLAAADGSDMCILKMWREDCAWI